jgi:hypothetical protein
MVHLHRGAGWLAFDKPFCRPVDSIEALYEGCRLCCRGDGKSRSGPRRRRPFKAARDLSTKLYE